MELSLCVYTVDVIQSEFFNIVANKTQLNSDFNGIASPCSFCVHFSKLTNEYVLLIVIVKMFSGTNTGGSEGLHWGEDQTQLSRGQGQGHAGMDERNL